jgi:predicted nucleic acid-binding protein
VSAVADASVLAAATTDTGAQFEPFAGRVWELRRNLTSYDAWYVAVAEALDLPLATLDRRLGRATGTSCRVRVPS